MYNMYTSTVVGTYFNLLRIQYFPIDNVFCYFCFVFNLVSIPSDGYSYVVNDFILNYYLSLKFELT